MAKHPNEIALELKEKKMKEATNNNQCMFTQVDTINACIQDLSDRIDNLPTSSDLFIWNHKLCGTREILDDNFKRCNEMLNELKGVVSMARAAVAERKECENVLNSNTKKCCNVIRDNTNETLAVLESENYLLRTILEKTQEKLHAKKWWQFWK